MLRLAYRLGTNTESGQFEFDAAALSAVSLRGFASAPFAVGRTLAVPKRHSPQIFLNPVLAILGEARGGTIASALGRFCEMRGGTCAL